MADLGKAPSIVQWGVQNIGEYDFGEYVASLERAFKERQADFVVLDSFLTGQKFLAASVAWAMTLDFLYYDASVDTGQSEIYSFRLTDVGREYIVYGIRLPEVDRQISLPTT